MSYDKALYEAKKHWLIKQKRERRIALEKAESLKRYEEHKDELSIVKKASFIAYYISKVDYNARWISVEDVLQNVTTAAELDFYYDWCCGRLF